MRQIKFRGKDADEWRYGSLIQYPNGDAVIVEFDKDGNELSWDVAPDTVGHFTGLYDRDGNEIYEGDIVRLNYKYDHINDNGTVTPDQDCFCRGIVVFDETYGFVLQLTEAEFPINRDWAMGDWLELSRFDWEGDSNEILGNIHDKPELLKGGKR